MDTNYNYPQLFDMDDTDLFHGLNLSDNVTVSSSSNQMYNTTTNFDKKLNQQSNNNNNQDIYNSLASASNNTSSYLHYLQSNNTDNNNNNHNNEFYYETPSQVMLMVPPTMDLTDYDYFNQQTTEQKQQYNWLYDPMDAFLPNQSNLFCDNPMPNPPLDSVMTENMDESITVEGGMSRGYVSLSDVNSFVAKADSKHSCLLQVPNNDFNNQRRNEFSSSESTINDDSEDDYSDSENEMRWPSLNSSFSTPTIHSKQKLMIKIKKPSSNSALPSPYGEHPTWSGLISPKLSKSANTYRNKYRKSASNIYNITTKKKNKLLDNTKRRGSAPQRLTHNHSTSSLNSIHSSSSLSSLSNTLQRSMRVSDSMNFLTRHSSDEEEEAIEDEEEDDEDDDEYQIRTAHASSQLPTKKGRNVDKACNHCKRSHLRCDDMRPCRRCVATGKTGCKDVQHKPRGRPKLHVNNKV